MPPREQQRDRSRAPGRLTARPAGAATTGAEQAAAAPRAPESRDGGTRPLKRGRGRDGLLYVPPGLAADRPAPLVVLLHGAGGDARGTLPLLQGFTEAVGCLVVVPESRQETWDVIRRGDYGPDVAYLDAALADTFASHAVDPAHVAIAGFSDGASYALSLGVANGDLFTHVIAFSPGFMAPPVQVGTPRIFVSHGTHDTVLPIDACSRRVVPQLERAGYDVRYEEFPGGHTVPAAIVQRATEWFEGGGGRRAGAEGLGAGG